MKQFISILIITIIVNVLCIWDLIFTHDVFKTMKTESDQIYEALLSTPITDENVSGKITVALPGKEGMAILAKRNKA